MCYFNIDIIGSSNSPFALYTGANITGMIQNDGGIVSMPGLAAVAAWATFAGNVDAIANNIDGTLDIVVSPATSDIIRWFATVRLNNVSFTL
jgi:hypothetical protein